MSPRVSHQNIEPASPLIVADTAMQLIRKRALEVAGFDTIVLLEGETGTGKEVIARFIHEHSRRRGGPFVVVDCGVVAESLIESELFGHVRGAYTGAEKDRIGRLESAAGGTLLLDEIANLPAAQQPALLRFTETSEIARVGDGGFRKIDVRIIAASNIPLATLIQTGRIRQDLYHRLSVCRISIPPVRERIREVPVLFRHFLEHFARRHGVPLPEISEAALDLLENHPWPGNVREIRNVAETVVIGADGKRQGIDEILHALIQSGYEGQAARARAYGGKLADPRFLINYLRVREESGGNISSMARQLNVTRRTIYKYNQVLNLPHPNHRRSGGQR